MNGSFAAGEEDFQGILDGTCTHQRRAVDMGVVRVEMPTR